MFVLTRGILTAGMATYAVVHFYQMASPPEDSPGWLAFMYGLTAVVALVIAALSLLDERPRRRYAAAGAALSFASAIALGLSLTVGFLGVDSTDLQPAAGVVLVAEVMTIGAWLALVGARRSSEYAVAETSQAEREFTPVDRPRSA